eukprot:scaffold80517_cov60-Phaeocystis_antarctica.AAC.1
MQKKTPPPMPMQQQQSSSKPPTTLSRVARGGARRGERCWIARALLTRAADDDRDRSVARSAVGLFAAVALEPFTDRPSRSWGVDVAFAVAVGDPYTRPIPMSEPTAESLSEQSSLAWYEISMQPLVEPQRNCELEPQWYLR